MERSNVHPKPYIYTARWSVAHLLFVLIKHPETTRKKRLDFPSTWQEPHIRVIRRVLRVVLFSKTELKEHGWPLALFCSPQSLYFFCSLWVCATCRLAVLACLRVKSARGESGTSGSSRFTDWVNAGIKAFIITLYGHGWQFYEMFSFTSALTIISDRCLFFARFPAYSTSTVIAVTHKPSHISCQMSSFDL